MTEQEWLACTDLQAMLDHLRRRVKWDADPWAGQNLWDAIKVSAKQLLRGFIATPHKLSNRKLRLIVCALVRQRWHLLEDERSRKLVELAERFADDEASLAELTVAREAAVKALEPDPVILARHRQALGLDPVPPADPRAEDMEQRHASWTAAERETWNGRQQQQDWAGRALRVAESPSDLRAMIKCGSRLFSTTREKARIAGKFRDIVGNPFHPVRFAPGWLTSTVESLAQSLYHQRAFERLPILGDALEEAGCTDAATLDHCRQESEHVRGCYVVDLILGKG